MASTEERDYGATKDAAVDSASVGEVRAEAQIAADKELEMSFMEAIRSYPTAVAWAIFFSLGVIMAVCQTWWL